MSHLDLKLQKRRKHAIACQTYGQCKTCWDYNRIKCIYTLPNLKNAHTKYMNKHDKQLMNNPHPIISVKPYQMIPFLHYYPIDDDQNPIAQGPAPIVNIEITYHQPLNHDNHNQRKIHYGSNKWGHQQIRKRIAYNNQYNQHYRQIQNKTFKWKLSKRRGSKRRQLKDIKYDDIDDSTKSCQYSIHSMYFKRDITQNICDLCEEYVYPSTTKLVQCNSCTKYLSKQAPNLYATYRACKSCWYYYNLCDFKKRGFYPLRCPYIECSQCHSFQSPYCENPVLSISTVKCKLCVGIMSDIYGSKPEETHNDKMYACNRCIEDNDYCTSKTDHKCIFIKCSRCKSMKSRLSESVATSIHELSCIPCCIDLVLNHGYDGSENPNICNMCVDKYKYCPGRNIVQCHYNTCNICGDMRLVADDFYMDFFYDLWHEEITEKSGKDIVQFIHEFLNPTKRKKYKSKFRYRDCSGLGSRAKYCDNCGSISCLYHNIRLKDENGLLHDNNDKRNLCLYCVSDTNIEMNNLFNIISQALGDIACNDIIKIITEYTKGYCTASLKSHSFVKTEVPI